MSKFREYYFSDLYEMSSGISTKPEQAGHGYKFISFKTVFNNYYLPEDINELMDTNEDERNLYSVKEGDIFLTRTSEVDDELGMSCVALRDYPDTTFSGFLKRLRPKQSNITYHKYLTFYLRSKYFRKAMSNNSIMTLRASLNEQIFSYLKLILPPYAEQVKIGDLLFSLSEKIELNNKINAELEAIAKTLYNYWFVQFDFPDSDGRPYKSSDRSMVYNEILKREIPESWEVKRLGKTCLTSLGGTPSTKISEYWNGNINWLNSGEVANFPIINSDAKISESAIKNSATKLLKKGTVLISITRHLRANILGIDACVNQSVVGIEENETYKRSFLYPFINNEIPRLMTLRTGAQQPHINKEIVDDCLILNPSGKTLEKYYELSEPIFEKIVSNAKQNQELSDLRDWLLPMLINGQVKVGEAYEQVEEVLSMAAESETKYDHAKFQKV